MIHDYIEGFGFVSEFFNRKIINRAVLIIPPSPWLISDTDVPMLGILYIAGALKRLGMDYQVCDLSGVEEKSWNIPIGTIYGITGTSPQFIYMKKIINILKDRDRKAMIVCGGAHASTYAEHILDNTRADACIVGEGERSMVKLMYGDIAIEDIPNIVLRTNSNGIYMTRPVYANINSYALPDRDSIDFYKYLKVKTNKYIIGDCREAHIFTSRGCPYSCSFCAQKSIWGSKVRYRGINYVIDEIQMLKDKYGVNLIWIMDDTFILKRERVKEFCQKIKKADIKWHCLSRPDTIDTEIAQMMSDSGCMQITMGFETGSDRMLNAMNKGFSVSQSNKAVRIIKKAGMKIRGQIMVGFPGEDDESIKETKRFIARAEVDAFGIHIFQPFPGCDVWSHPDKYNYELNKDTDFSEYHTIGKIGEISSKDKKIHQWAKELEEIASDRNTYCLGAME